MTENNSKITHILKDVKLQTVNNVFFNINDQQTYVDIKAIEKCLPLEVRILQKIVSSSKQVSGK